MLLAVSPRGNKAAVSPHRQFWDDVSGPSAGGGAEKDGGEANRGGLGADEIRGLDGVYDPRHLRCLCGGNEGNSRGFLVVLRGSAGGVGRLVGCVDRSPRVFVRGAQSSVLY